MNSQIVMSITGHQSYNSFKKYVNLVTTDKQKALKETWGKQPLKLVEVKTTKAMNNLPVIEVSI